MPIDLEGCYPKGGMIADYMRFAEPFEFPRSYALFSLLAAASCAVEGRILVNPGTQPSPFTNLYVLLYGPSGCRKGAAMEYARELLARALPDSPILPSSGTMQGIMDELAEKTAELGRAPGMIYAEEFSDFIGGADYLERNSIFLTKLYDCRGEVTERTRTHKKITVRNPYVVVLGASNPDWFEQINPRLLSGGFLRRLLLVVEYGPRQEAASPTVNTVLFNALVDRFRDRFSPASFPGALMRLDGAAQELNRQWYHDVIGELRRRVASERESHFVNTMQEHALKLGAMIELLERNFGAPVDTMHVESLACGQKLVLRLLPGIFQAYRSLSGTPLAKLKAATIRIARNAVGMTPQRLDRAVRDDTGMDAQKVAQAREELLNDGVLVLETDGKVRVR